MRACFLDIIFFLTGSSNRLEIRSSEKAEMEKRGGYNVASAPRPKVTGLERESGISAGMDRLILFLRWKTRKRNRKKREEVTSCKIRTIKDEGWKARASGLGPPFRFECKDRRHKRAEIAVIEAGGWKRATSWDDTSSHSNTLQHSDRTKYWSMRKARLQMIWFAATNSY